MLIQKISEYLHIFIHSFIVKSTIERVWHFYTDIKHLEIITPKQIDLKITNATSPNVVQGQEIWCNGKIIELPDQSKALKDYISQTT